MAIVSEFPRSVRLIENTWIPLSDGTRLAAKIWLPDGPDTAPAPAILEFLPYRKGDGTAIRDELVYPYLAGHGYAGVRVDIRGHGESDGIPEDEYTPQEQADGVEVIGWIAEQEWCSGAVGMQGISWGGFNSLQIAAHRPSALKAIITMCSTDDRYADDVHYKGGLVEAMDMQHWATYLLMANGEPPDPAIVGDRWRDLWLQRIDGNEPAGDIWLEHQRRDDYWKQGSVCEDLGAIECAVYAVGGWQDGYTNAIPRLLTGLSSPRKGLIGPWGHRWPQSGSPGPAIGYLQESLRWWDHWLKGEDTGIMDEPMLRAWVEDSVRPRTTYEERPGRWVTDVAWPPPIARDRRFSLNDGTLDPAPAGEQVRTILGRQTCGLDGGAWCGEGEEADDADDQRAEDGMSLVFDSAPLEDDVHILGFPAVTLQLASDRPRALVCVRLCEVFPDGQSTLVTRGLLNLCHRESHEHPEPLEPGKRYTIRVELDSAGHVFARGNRLRVAASPTYWPWAWPSPEPVTLTVFTGGTTLLALPEIPPGAGDDAAPFGPPETSPELPAEIRSPGHTSRTLVRDMHKGTTEMSFHWGSGSDVVYPHGIGTVWENDARYRIAEGDPLSAEVWCVERITYARAADDWKVTVEAEGRTTCDADSFHVESTFRAWEGDELVREREWRRSIPRDLG